MSQTTTHPTEVSNRSSTPARVQYLRPLADLRETPEGYVLQAEMPGVASAGLEVTVSNGELVIVGRRTAPPTGTTAVYRESRGADYRRAFELDSSIDTAAITARMEQGVLTLTLPKAESVRPRTIPVTD